MVRNGDVVRPLTWSVAAAAVAVCGGCAGKAVGPTWMGNGVLGPMTIAVAPALNVSGSPLEPNAVADVMASELSYVAGVEVIPVNRVLAVLAEQGRSRVESPGHALEIARIVGADAILVFAVTEYDAYEPPIVGIAAQLYGQRRGARAVGFDAVEDSRRGSPRGGGNAGSALAPLAQEERVFDASHDWVRQKVQRFSESRSADASPLGWRKYIASQKHYLRFCCHEVIRGLMGERNAAEAKHEAG